MCSSWDRHSENPGFFLSPRSEADITGESLQWAVSFAFHPGVRLGLPLKVPWLTTPSSYKPQAPAASCLQPNLFWILFKLRLKVDQVQLLGGSAQLQAVCGMLILAHGSTDPTGLKLGSPGLYELTIIPGLLSKCPQFLEANTTPIHGISVQALISPPWPEEPWLREDRTYRRLKMTCKQTASDTLAALMDIINVFVRFA